MSPINPKLALDKLLIVLTCFVIILGSLLRFDHIEKIYDEYDDVGVVAIQKAPQENVDREINFGPIKSVTLDNSYLKNIENTLWYGPFIGSAWTYAPGQYAISSFFLSDEMSARQRHLLLRYFSAAASAMTLILVAYALLRICPPNGSDKWLILPIVGLLAFSTNTILYAMHASPYSVYGLALTAAVLVASRALEGHGKFYSALLTLSFLCLFNYLVILVFALFLAFALFASTSDQRRQLFEAIRSAPLFFLVQSLLIVLPLLVMSLFLKVGAGARGVAVPPINGVSGLIEAMRVMQSQFEVVAYNLLYGGLDSQLMTNALAFLGGLLAVISLRSWITKRNYQALLSLFLIGAWVLLYILGKLTFDQSRHTLMLLPPFCLLLLSGFRPLVNRLPLAIMITASTMATLGMGIAGYSNAKEAFGPRTAILNKMAIEKHQPDFVLTYGFTLGPIIDFHEDKVQVINLDFNSSLVFDWSQIGQRDRVILVSQTEPMSQQRLNVLKTKFPELFEFRRLLKISEISTDVFFPFHSYPLSSNQNGAYIYELSS